MQLMKSHRSLAFCQFLRVCAFWFALVFYINMFYIKTRRSRLDNKTSKHVFVFNRIKNLPFLCFNQNNRLVLSFSHLAFYLIFCV